MYSNSALVNYVDRTAGKYAMRKEDTLIDHITIHCGFGSGDCYDLAEYVKSGSASFHYGIASDGTVCLFVDEQFRSYSCDSTEADETGVNIICMTTEEGAEGGVLSEKTYTALLDLVEDICRRNYMLELTYTGSAKTSNLTMHRWYANTKCPGAWLSSRYGTIARTISDRLTHAIMAENETEALKAQSTIAVKSINPYLAVLEPNTTGVDYVKLRTAGVIGAMFWAGAYFDPNHTARQRYYPPNLKKQVAEANRDQMPYALYATVRARNKEEARTECYWLWFTISKYPPKLGLWLDLQLSGSSSERRSVVDTYYDYILRWGLKDKCGFYATRAQLRAFTYTDYLDKFAVWLVAHEYNLSDLDSLLTPSLFKI